MILLGLIGKKLEHSYSKNWFKHQFETQNIEATYKNFEISSIQEIFKLLEIHSNLTGFNVTIPYKQTILPLLNKIDDAAVEVGAVNTVGVSRKGHNIELHGYNTDIYGFKCTLDQLPSLPKSAIVFGNGGAAKAIKYVLRQNNIQYKTVSRSGADFTYAELTGQQIEEHKLLINTTPVGMFPNIHKKLPIPSKYISSEHVLIDLIYNPDTTSFMQMGIEKGAFAINGQLMLEQQAKKALEIFSRYF